MSAISEKIKAVYPELVIRKDEQANALFDGRNLPAFVKDFIIRKFSDENGDVDEVAVREYLAAKMPTSKSNIMMRLMDGETINITSRVNIKTELNAGKVTFTLPDIDINADMFIQPKVLDDHKGEICDGEEWANVTLQYFPPEGKKKGYVLMTSYKPFNPYKNLDFDKFIEGRKNFTTEEWIDVLTTIIGYDPDCFKSMESKLTLLSRLIIGLEPNLNMMEFGPKGTGKSYIYNNLTGYFRMIFNRCTRAQLVYNQTTKRWGAIKSHDAILFDEVSTMQFEDRDGELLGFFKVFCEDGKASLANVKLISECGIGLVGNIQLDENFEPVNDDYEELLPDIFRSSAMLDRFHYFVKGWKASRVTMGQIYYGWTIDNEYFAEYLHYMRSQSCYKHLFDELVTYNKAETDTRDCKAVKKAATALCKLLFPHVKDTKDLMPEDLEIFKQLYKAYCLDPAVEGRAIIRRQCHLIDKEFSLEMPVFEVPLNPVQEEKPDVVSVPVPEDAPEDEAEPEPEDIDLPDTDDEQPIEDILNGEDEDSALEEDPETEEGTDSEEDPETDSEEEDPETNPEEDPETEDDAKTEEENASESDGAKA